MTKIGCSLLAVVLLALLGSSPALGKGRKLYLDVRGVKEPERTTPSLRGMAQTVLVEELKRHPEVVTSLGDPAPKGADLVRELEARKLDGYGVVLRITKVAHSLKAPPKGKVYKVLQVEVEVAVDAEKIPSGQMALAGEGSAQIGTEVSRYKESERVQLVKEALTDATRQAVGKAVVRLGEKDKPAKSRGKPRGKRKR